MRHPPTARSGALPPTARSGAPPHSYWPIPLAYPPGLCPPGLCPLAYAPWPVLPWPMPPWPVPPWPVPPGLCPPGLCLLAWHLWKVGQYFLLQVLTESIQRIACTLLEEGKGSVKDRVCS